MRNGLIAIAIAAVALAAYLLTRSSEPRKPAAGPTKAAPAEPAPAARSVERGRPPTLPAQPEAPTFRRFGGGGDERTPGDRRFGDERRRERLQRFDSNGDGQLDDAEREAMRAARMERRRERRLESFDSDGDGVLDEDERATLDLARADMRTERTQRLLRDLDGDADGKLSRAEAEQAGRRAQRILRDFDAADRDGDGLLDPDELQRTLARRRHREGRDAGPASDP